ncbi:hypothetical protein JYU34_014166 [Plutella xylostella]|uniref:Uncharacterized protein n=1 Tax=Plutella xylostella TaxID=51655 RepID=A0ABQ7Q7S8_PLUXY|nr:hypothetical protein JYU34_014166 [Plutella xylostella]
MDFSAVCRLCLSEDTLNTIFTNNQAEDKRYSTAIFLTTGIKVSENDGLPQKICSLCINYLNESLNYRKRCKEVENKLLEQSIRINKEEPLEFEVLFGESFTKTTLKSEAVKLKKSYNIETVKLETKPDVNFDVKNEVLNENIGDDEERESQEITIEYPIDEYSKSSHNSDNNIVLYIGNNDDDFNRDVKKEIEVTTTVEIPAKLKQKQSETDDEEDGDLPYEIDMRAPDQNRVVCKVKISHNRVMYGNVMILIVFQSKELQECDVCQKVMQRGSIKLHKAIKHAGLRPVCEHCGSTFGNKYRLQEHYRAKHGYEKFKCGHCDFESASAMALRNHERRHRGEKPFVCETCGAKFHAAYLLAQHKQSHRTERLAKCDLCPATFKARNSLHMHKLSVHSARVFACSLCTRVYSSRHYAARHLRRRHRGDGAQLTALSDDRVAVET